MVGSRLRRKKIRGMSSSSLRAAAKTLVKLYEVPFVPILVNELVRISVIFTCCRNRSKFLQSLTLYVPREVPLLNFSTDYLSAGLAVFICCGK